MTAWTDFVKSYASKNGISYGCALSDKSISEAYRLKNPKKLTKAKAKKVSEEQATASSALIGLATKAKKLKIQDPQNLLYERLYSKASTEKDIKNRIENIQKDIDYVTSLKAGLPKSFFRARYTDDRKASQKDINILKKRLDELEMIKKIK